MGWLASLFILCFWGVYYYYRSNGTRETNRIPLSAFTEAWLLGFALIVFVLEISSGTRYFRFSDAITPLVIYGLLFLLALLVLIIEGRRKRDSLPSLKGGFQSAEGKNSLRNVPLLILLVSTFITALVAVPNNWDSMTYHLPRVMHWLQNGSLAHYYTGIDRQISQPPGAEMLIVSIASFTDAVPKIRFANMIQWVAYLICIIETGRLVGLLGGGHTAKWSARLLVATIPMALLQASSTQNDLLMAALVVSTASTGLNAYYYGLEYRSSLFFFLAVALSFLTKGTAFIFLPVLLIFFLLISVRAARDEKGFQPGALLRIGSSTLVLLVLVGLVNLGHWKRNFDSFGSALGPSYELAAERFDPPAILSSLTKNSVQQLRTPVNSINSPMEKFATWFSERLGAKVDDPSLHWPYGPAFNLQTHSRREYVHEDYAPAPLHFLLGWLALFWLLRRWWKGRNSADGKIQEQYFIQAGLAVTVAIMWLLFAGVLKWQIWHPRLHLPFLVMLAFPAALFLESLAKHYRLLIIGIVFLAALPFALTNSSRSLIGEASIFKTSADQQRFINRPEVLPAYEGAIAAIAANHPSDSIQIERTVWNLPRIYSMYPNNFALITSGDAWEYPLWRMEIKDKKYNPFEPKRIFHFDVEQEVDSFSLEEYPKFFIYLKQEQPLEILYGYDRYKRIFQDPVIAVYCNYNKLGERIEYQREPVRRLEEIF